MKIGIGALISALLSAAPASAVCPVADSGSGAARPLDPASKGDVDLLLSASMMPKLMHVDYQSVTSQPLPCAMATFQVNGIAYTLQAREDGTPPRRSARSSANGAAIATLVPVADVVTAITQHRPASVSSYLLATLDKNGLTGWRLYTGIPNRATLVADMAAALGGSLRPIFRTDTQGQTQVFVAR